MGVVVLDHSAVLHIFCSMKIQMGDNVQNIFDMLYTMLWHG